MASVTRYVEEKLKLTVNRLKSKCARRQEFGHLTVTVKVCGEDEHLLRVACAWQGDDQVLPGLAAVGEGIFLYLRRRVPVEHLLAQPMLPLLPSGRLLPNRELTLLIVRQGADAVQLLLSLPVVEM